jgi:hypothetical protein
MSDAVNTGEIAIIENAPISSIRAYSSIQGTDLEARLALANAVTASVPLTEVLDKEIALRNIVVQPVEMKNDRTGELSTVARMTLVTEDGIAYHATSGPLHRDLTNLLTILGPPAQWGRAIKIVVTKEGKGNSAYFTLKSVK